MLLGVDPDLQLVPNDLGGSLIGDRAWIVRSEFATADEVDAERSPVVGDGDCVNGCRSADRPGERAAPGEDC
jgi:hypothetical protein